MTSEVAVPSSGANPFVAYERSAAEAYFARALQERARLLGEIATARRRIAEAKAALAEITETEYSCMGAMLDAHRTLREEERANERAIAAMHAGVEAQAEHLLHDTRARVHRSAMRRGDDGNRFDRPPVASDGG